MQTSIPAKSTSTIDAKNGQPPGEKLLRCLRMEADQPKNAALLDFSNADWQSIIEIARRHDLIPYLYWRLEKLPVAEHIPAKNWAEMRTILMSSAQRNTRIYHQLEEALTALKQAGIPVILLKGAHLADSVYADCALRPMGDIDLLVRLDDLHLTIQTFGQLDYQSTRRYQMAKELRSNHHLPPFEKDGATGIELHWSIVPNRLSLRVDTPGIWRRAEPLDIAGAQALSAADLIFHLCTHLCQHEFGLGLKSIVDISETIQKNQKTFDWDKFVHLVGEWKATKYIYLSLYLAHEMLGAPLPGEVLQTLRPPDFNSQIADLARRRLLSFATPAPIQPDLAKIWSNRRPVSARLQTLSNVLFPPPEKIAGRYGLPAGARRTYFYYPKHIKDLFEKYGGQLWRLFRREPTTLAQTGQQNALADWLMSP